jgi:hypothetical protein
MARARATSAVDSIPRLAWSLDQAAARLGLSTRTFFELRATHPLYAPDGSRTIVADAKKDMPLWSDDLIRLIAFARTLTPQGVRQLSDDEALKIRNAMANAKRTEYLAYVG